MKKLVLIGLLALVVVSAGVFADHPSGWGLGGGVRYGSGWDTTSDGRLKGGLHIKVPPLPVYWNINSDIIGMGTDNSALEFNLTGDYYIIDKTLAENIGLGWFLGVGAYLDFHYRFSGIGYNGIGARLPIGLSWQPLDFLEIFMNIAPNLGVRSYFGYDAPKKIDFPFSGWQRDLAVRFWF
jgi:opacity protein-like surface antigen